MGFWPRLDSITPRSDSLQEHLSNYSGLLDAQRFRYGSKKRSFDYARPSRWNGIDLHLTICPSSSITSE
jgi:hypothetical protein